jgi:predicted AAA+ superfamily ATPase
MPAGRIMVDYGRNMEATLLDWKKSQRRKPLILRGARQVGKTTVVRQFGKRYKQYIELNLEKKAEGDLFATIPNIQTLAETIFLLRNKRFTEQDTLLFIDEIQAVPEAINQLRYFYEELPWLHVIAAGSLLETLLHEQVRIPVGRVEYAVLRPVCFEEYLQAMGEEGLLQLWRTLPFPNYAFSLLLPHYHKFTLMGGMPEVIDAYREKQDLAGLSGIYRALQEGYKNDVDKYAQSSTMVQTIRHAIDSLPTEAGVRIKFEGFGKSNYGSREMGEALRTLEKAMLLHLLYPTTQHEFPLMPNLRKSPRLQMLDTGLLNFYSGLQPQMLALSDLNSIQGGRIIEHMTGQEILAASHAIDHRLQWWTREEKHAMAEVDFILQVQGHIIPVEVKSGATGTLRSLLYLMDLLPHPYALRLYAGPLLRQEAITPGGKKVQLLSLPYFLAGQVERYAAWWMGEAPR